MIALLEQWNAEPPLFLYPGDPRANAILGIKNDSGDEAAILALTVMLRGSLNIGNMRGFPIQSLGGFFKGYLLDAGFADPTPYQSDVLISFLGKEAQKFQDARTAFEITHGEVKEKVDVTQTEIERIKGEGRETKDEAYRQIALINEQLAKSKQELEDLKKTMSEGLALRAPVEYWKANSSEHDKLAKKYGRWIGVGSAFIIAYILLTIPAILHASAGGKPDLWELGVSAATTGLLLYLLRIVVRIQLSHLHLSTDAAQRAVMVQTYLSLEHDKEVITKEDRHLILDALFRPIGAGLVKDDQASLNILEPLLNKK